MKNILAICFLFITTIVYSQQIDTIYYDKEWKGVENKAFADYYRVAIIPDNPNYPKRFRDFFISGKIYASGSFISIDKYDDSKSIFDGKYSRYYDNGNEQVNATYSNGEIIFAQHFYNNGKPKCEMNVNKGVRHGEYKYFYESGALYCQCLYDNGKVSGLLKYYDENGNTTYSANFNNEIIDGEEIYYQNGTPILITNYDKGLPVGVIEDRSNGSIVKKTVKNIGGDTNEGYRISCSAYIGQIAIKQTGMLMALMAGTATGEKYQSFLCFDLRLINDIDKDVNLSIDNVNVEYIYKKKHSENLAYSEEIAVKLFQTSAEHTANKAYADAAYVAQQAASQVVTSSASTSSYNTTNTESKTNSSKSGLFAALGAAIGGAVGADNSGNSAAVVGGSAAGVAGASSSQTNTTTTGSVRQSSGTHSLNTTTHVDGYTQYHVYNSEAEKAAQVALDASSEMVSRVESVRYSHIKINPNQLVLKRILAKEEKKYDIVKLSFSIKGTPYSVEFSTSEIM